VSLMADLQAGLDALHGWLRLTEKQLPSNLRAQLAITREMRAHIELMARMTAIMGHANTALSERQERTILGHFFTSGSFHARQWRAYWRSR
jgi:hypothetical protein